MTRFGFRGATVMSRAILALPCTLLLSACSLGHISLPVALTGPKEKAASAPAPRWGSKTALGGPSPADPSASPSDALKSSAVSCGAAGSAAADPGLVDLINDLRRSRGLSPLIVSPQLGEAARAHVADLARLATLTHRGPDGSTPIDRVRRAGYRPRMAAENIAGGQMSAAEAVRTWCDSESHLTNLLLPEARHIGVARLEDPRSSLRVYWALVVAQPL